MLLGAAAGVQLTRSLLEARPLAASIASVLLVDWIASRADASWHGDANGWRRWSKGAALGLGCAAMTVALTLLTGSASLSLTAPSPLSLGLGLIDALATAVTSELLYRWIPSRIFAQHFDDRALFALGAVLGAAPLLLEGSVSAVLVAVTQGALSMALLQRTRAFAPLVACHAALWFATSTLLSSPLSLRLSAGVISPLTEARGPGAYALACVLTLAALAVRVAPTPSRQQR